MFDIGIAIVIVDNFFLAIAPWALQKIRTRFMMKSNNSFQPWVSRGHQTNFYAVGVHC